MTTKVYTKNLSNKKNRVIGVVLLALGIILLGYFFFPIASYHLFLSKALASTQYESPIPSYVVREEKLKNLLQNRVASLTTDYTDARNWFPEVNSKIDKPQVEEYYLTIPKLGIERAKVATNQYDLSQYLVQYYGASNPPENGTSVIYGHSSLPQFFNPKNYKSIFATLHTAQIGDEIQVHVSGDTYRYKIFAIEIKDPEDVSIFSQSFDSSYITLVTCTPPGTIWKRLVVRATIDEGRGV